MSRRKILYVMIGILLASGMTVAYISSSWIFASNIKLNGGSNKYIFIPTGSDFDGAVAVLRPYLVSESNFVRLAKWKGYDKKVKPGRYLLYNNMTNNQLVDLLRSGNQSPVRVIFNNVRVKADIAGKVARYIESDSLQIYEALLNPETAKKYGFSEPTLLCMFIPNTYEMFWNTSAEQFLDRMKKEYDKFWTDERVKKAKQINLSPVQVSTLASIVQSETNKKDEKPRVAGVYINRLDQGIPLQADPTLIWALNDFTIKRVLDVHKEIESPYNTYKYAGLPPGPICLPSPESLDAVLNYEKHSYLYFCAKEDFSGYSNFAETYQQHLQNARRYQQALNKRGVY